MDELIVFLMRAYGWTLEYTIDLVDNLAIDKLTALVKETKYQMAVDDYMTARNFAMVIANWASAQGKKKYKVSDFIGNPPKREEQEEPGIAAMASRKGIIIPKGGL